MQIGIPGALLYQYYISFWRPFFEDLGFRVVISGNTNKELVNQGVKVSVPELCVPVKIFIGHVFDLLDKGVDFVFIPRMEAIRRGEFFCPKFMGLPAIMKYGVPGVKGKLLTCQINARSDDISNYKHYLPLLDQLELSIKELKKAAAFAGEKWKRFRTINKMGYTACEANKMVLEGVSGKELLPKENNNDIKLGLLGYVYNIYDDFVNMGITGKLNQMGIDFITFDMYEEELLDQYVAQLSKPLFWTFTNKLLGAGYQMLQKKLVDGIIHITAFGCGPDAFLGRLLELESDRAKTPYMLIRIDEHTGENHLQTRVEAFIDMLKRRKSKIS